MISVKKICLFVCVLLAFCVLTGCENQEDNTPPTDITISIFVSARTVLSQDNAQSKLGEEKFNSLSQNDGTLLNLENLAAKSNEKLHDVLKREFDKIGISYVLDNTLTGTYVRSIHGIGEFTFGASSGWYYYVNGISPSYAVSSHKLKDKDQIKLLYTCNMGQDLKTIA